MLTVLFLPTEPTQNIDYVMYFTNTSHCQNSILIDMLVHHASIPPLPIFPSSTFQKAPSKSALSLQGLGRALIDAEVIDPDMILPVPMEGADDGGSCLSEKIRKRLHESGITELFAGVSVILFLSQCFLDLL